MLVLGLIVSWIADSIPFSQHSTTCFLSILPSEKDLGCFPLFTLTNKAATLSASSLGIDTCLLSS